ncbi:cell division protein SepF [Actinophytocola sp.]|uniref:cell division protein SepF n=1 Tax=Actinophytocola sp. TaxID=1872138 RepID=UPI002ED3BC8E
MSLVAASLVTRAFRHRLEQPSLHVNVPWVSRDGTSRLTAALEDAEWLASLAGNPPPNPAVHLQQAARINPTNYRESARQVRESLQRGHVVLLDLAGADEDTAVRLIDFCSAITLALNGVIQQLSSTVLLLTPHSD